MPSAMYAMNLLQTCMGKRKNISGTWVHDLEHRYLGPKFKLGAHSGIHSNLVTLLCYWENANSNCVPYQRL